LLALSETCVPETPRHWAPLQGPTWHSRRSPARLRRPSWDLSPLQRRPTRRSTDPGFHPRFVPSSEFLTLLTVSSLRVFPASRSRDHGPVPLMGFALQSFSPPRSRPPFDVTCLLAVSDIASFCSEDQEVTMPRDSKALLPAEIRTRVRNRSRARADALLGLFASPDPFLVRRRSGFPPPSLLRFLRSFY